MGVTSNVVPLFPARGTLVQKPVTEVSAQMYADAHRIIDEGMPEIAAEIAERPADRPLAQAVATYRAAWQAFQDAPEGPESSLAEEAETKAFWQVLGTVPQSQPELTVLIEFLQWYASEEAQRFGNGPCDDLPFAYLAALYLALERWSEN